MHFSKLIKLFSGLALICLFSASFARGDDSEPGESQFLSNVRQLLYDGRRSGEGYFSPDGKALVFQSEREPGNPFFQIYILDLETGDSHRISPGIGKTTCAFFRPGTNEVLFASTHLDPQAETKQQKELEFRASGKEHRYSWDYDEQMDIFVAKRDGTNLRRLSDTPGYDAEGSYSPDGSKIVFCSLRDAYPIEKLSEEDKKRFEVNPAYFGEIYIMNADGSNQTRLTDWPGYDGGPFFTPDGGRIVWRHFEENGMQADVYTMRLDGSDIRRLTEFDAMSWAPYFHLSGKYVIFASNKLGFSNFELFMVDALGKHKPVRVTFTDGFDGLPVFSPDGKQLCWTSNRTSDNRSQLFIGNWDHGAALAAINSAPMRGEKPSTKKMPYDSGSTDGQNGADEKSPDKAALSPEISREDIKTMVGYLASDELEGRMTGTEGIQLAADYIADQFTEAGLQPMGHDETYFQEFQFTSGLKLLPEQNHLQLTLSHEKPIEFQVDEDFRPLGFTANETVEGEVVFAGYGLSVPGKLGEGYDSYAGLDVEDKIVLVLRYVPEEVDVERRQQLNHYAGLRYKAMIARENGAKGIMVVAGPNSPKAGELVPLSFDRSLANSGIVAMSISGKLANKMFAAVDKDLEEVQTQLDLENPHFEGTFPLSNVWVNMSAGVKRIKKPDRNVVGLLPASAPGATNEYVVVGAHYDHIGYGEIGSLAHKGEEGQIHNGADDNASGTSTLLELAASLAEAQKANPDEFKRGIIFACWSGEELGLIGSTYFVENSPVPLENIVAYVNFDMVGRLKDNKLILQGLGSSSVWPKLIEKRNVAAGFNLVLQKDPYQPTDVSAFYPKQIPVLSFFTGSHDDYNRPTDDPETLDYQGLERIAEFSQGIIKDLANRDERPEYVKVERKKQETGSREGLRAYLGTIPDYTGDAEEGVKLSGVSAGGPADKGGLEGGDVIIRFAGQKITNIYDYTYALDAVKIGEPVKLVVLRDGEEVTLTVTPEARE
ncbi:M28 family peptidase [candidate division KSB1 bacterium]|nr:M28 family peptidase [candidate division KSB1 bacterium]NIR72629.1 M28 family peptidase [candidate division KSB1 bacterium]NIS27340.1 M28 family peptidase [candidate division KSB1 bacterium]NIT73553.1 M28 family peptidase [candidate division KSB1 bacterium]NIU25401.1 M28 family peptidase [candidate division KSB1 bacterium]